jgi:hypothetical protein
MKGERTIRVIHYGPQQVPDPDCSTSIVIEVEGETKVGADWVGLTLSLENDAELDDLTNQLIAIRDGLNHLNQKEIHNS